MTVGVNKIITEINSKLTSCGSDPQTLLQLTASAAALENSYLVVADETKLPTASENKGRFAYIESLCDYRYSNGTEWSRKFESSQFPANLVYTWGQNSTVGQLATGNTINNSSPVSIIGGYTDWCSVSAGTCNVGAIRADGTIWMWGRGNNGQIGDGFASARCSPTIIAGGFKNWCYLSVGGYISTFSAAMRSDGSIWVWGQNNYGMGDGTTTARSSPVSIAGGFTWCQVSAGGLHAVAIRNDGTAWSWGRNNYGQLGNGVYAGPNMSSPVSVVGGLTWCQVSAGYGHTLAIRNDGYIWAWGRNTFGQLGSNNTVPKSVPSYVAQGGLDSWCQISAGTFHSTAIRTNGSLWSWGCNATGQLGDNTVICRSSPVQVTGGFTDWCMVSAGKNHTAAIRTNGELWTWGANGCGILGDGTTIQKSSPISIIGGINSWCKVSLGSCHSAALATDIVLRGFNTP